MNAYFVYNFMVLGTELRSLNIVCTLPLSYIPSLVYDLKNMHPIYVESSANIRSYQLILVSPRAVVRV